MNAKKNKTLKDFVAIASDILVSIGVITGIVAMIVAYKQYEQTKRLDEKRLAIEAINTTNEIEFIKAYARLKTLAGQLKLGNYDEELLMLIYEGHNFSKNVNLVIDDVNYVLTTYNNISLLYFNNLANQEILEAGTYAELREFSKIMERITSKLGMPFPKQRFEALLNELVRRDWFEEELARKVYEPKYSPYLN